MLRSAFTRVFGALCLAAWCAADPGAMHYLTMGPGSAEQPEERCTASGTRDHYSSKNVTVSATLARVVR